MLSAKLMNLESKSWLHMKIEFQMPVTQSGPIQWMDGWTTKPVFRVCVCVCCLLVTALEECEAI